MENIAFGAVTKLGRFRPSAIPRLSRLIPSSGRTEYVKSSYEIFASPRWVRFYEMEYAVPREHIVEAVNGVRAAITDNGFNIGFPVEVRFTAPDDIPLSTASGRDSAYVAVHVAKGMDYEPYFRAVEDVMNKLEGRPHWGKLNFQTADVLKTRYPMWDKFQAVRETLDPNRVFANDYTERVLGGLVRV